MIVKNELIKSLEKKVKSHFKKVINVNLLYLLVNPFCD